MKYTNVSDIITVYGATDGTSTTGTFTLHSKDFTNTPTYIQLDKGVKFKIWSIRISGAPATIRIEYTDDVTASPPTWTTIDSYHLPSSGSITLEKRRPIIIYGRTGNEAVRFVWDQTTTGAGVTEISVEIEIEPMTEAR